MIILRSIVEEIIKNIEYVYHGSFFSASVGFSVGVFRVVLFGLCVFRVGVFRLGVFSVIVFRISCVQDRLFLTSVFLSSVRSESLGVFRVVFKSKNTLIMLLSTYCIVHE